MFQAAVVQLTSSSDSEANWRTAEGLIRDAARAGAAFISTPENTPYLGPHEEKTSRAEPLDGPTCERFAALARDLGIHLLLGSYAERSDDPRRSYNTSVLFGPDGHRLASYRTIHLFDVDVSPEVRFTESETVRAGSEPVVASTELGTIGLTVCYDLRFPGLYQELRRLGADIITVPSAFTSRTGRDHWHTLVRARAIETQCYVVAAAQHGRHDDGGIRESYGHSLIVDPWGEIVAEVSEGTGYDMAVIDRERIREVRRAIPVADHARW